MQRFLRVPGDAADAESPHPRLFHLFPDLRCERRIDDLRAGRYVNPDTSISLDIAGAYQVRGGTANLTRALTTVDAVLRSEPDNLDAWAALYSIQRARNDPAGQADALRHAQRLDPLDFRSR